MRIIKDTELKITSTDKTQNNNLNHLVGLHKKTAGKNHLYVIEFLLLYNY